MKNELRQYKGDIVLGARVMVSDPCYGLGTWCQGVVDNVVPGTYKCHVEYYDDHFWGNRVSAIEVINDSYYFNVLDYKEENFEVGVDSGHAGIFDYAYYAQHHMDRHEHPHVDDGWYDRVCGLTHVNNRLTGNAIDCLGFVSSSGYGDGSYYCYTADDQNGNVIAIRVEFITEDDEEYDEDEYYDDED